jgi:SpoIID/LytB domain protein
MCRPVRAGALAVLLSFAAVFGPAAGASSRRPPSPPAGLVVDVARIEPLAAGARDTFVRLDGVGDYRGALELRRTGTGVGAVNDVALEDYVKGIAEMPSGWPVEALRAQAIASRTYALWVIQSGSAGEAAGLGAQICATDGCQVYAGLAKERAPSGASWVAAVDATRGQVLLDHGAPLMAKYSSSNGGRSVAGGRPYLKAVDDPDDARSPLHHWTLALGYDDVGRALAAPGPLRSLRREGGNVVAEWTGAGGAGGGIVLPVSEFRAKVNGAVAAPATRSTPVPSLQFTLAGDDAARAALLDGRGYGHGIGMGQWGAYGKALRGLRAADILAAYYGGIRPSAPPAAKVPPSVRVAIDAGRPEALVTASGPFRVLDGRGRVMASVATGGWRVLPGPKGGLRLLPPPGQAGPPRLEVIGGGPAPVMGEPASLRFRSTVPSLVSVRITPPGGPESLVMAPRPLGTEPVTVSLPAPAGAGPYAVSITADAGAGRTTSLALTPEVVDPAALRSTVVTNEPDRPVLARASRSAPVAGKETGSEPGPRMGDRAGGAIGLLAVMGAGVFLARRRSTDRQVEPL